MSGYLTKIKTKIPYSDKEVDIDVGGKTLILTGGNGCGKTQLMNFLFTKLKESIIEKKNNSIEQLKQNLAANQYSLKDIGPANQLYDYYKDQIDIIKTQIKDVENPPIRIDNLEEFVINYQHLKSVLISFEAMRRSSITKPSSVTSLDKLRSQDNSSTHTSANNSSSMFEEFLVTNIANQAFAESKKINYAPDEAMRIEKWFNKLEADLQDLFEDRTLKLIFKSDSMSFEIHR
ncbi:hypothetical protein ACK36E_15690 [Aeromonas veronii]